MDRSSYLPKQLALPIFFLFVTFCSFLVPIYFWKTLTIGSDWDLADSLNLVVRSSVFSYHRFPIHDPWIWGGADILCNPLNRIFSPMGLLDLLFSPHTASLLSLIINGFVGLWGMYRLLRFLGTTRAISIVVAILFINSSYFSLHYAIGHIRFDSLQLLPWILWTALQMDRPKCQFVLVSLLAFFLLEGGIVSFVYALGLIITALILQPSLLRKNFLVRRTMLLAVMFLCLVAPKMVPVLMSISNRNPQWVDFSIPLNFLSQIFLYPFQHILVKVPENQGFNFHEYGCYLGILSVSILAYGFCSKEFPKKNLKYLLILAFWFWFSSGWGGMFNPSTIYKHIPLFNNVRIPSRLFILFQIFFLILLSKSLQAFPNKQIVYALMAILLAESFFIRNYIFIRAFHDLGKPIKTTRLISSNTLTKTVLYGSKPSHYYNNDRGCVTSYDPSITDTFVSCPRFPNYRGEAYFVNQEGSVKIERYTPGIVEVSYEAKGPGLVCINTNSLWGWKVVSGQADIFQDETKLLMFSTKNKSGRVVLHYKPFYFLPLVAAYFFGLLMFFYLGGTIFLAFPKTTKYQKDEQAPSC